MHRRLIVDHKLNVLTHQRRAEGSEASMDRKKLLNADVACLQIRREIAGEAVENSPGTSDKDGTPARLTRIRVQNGNFSGRNKRGLAVLPGQAGPIFQFLLGRLAQLAAPPRRTELRGPPRRGGIEALILRQHIVQGTHVKTGVRHGRKTGTRQTRKGTKRPERHKATMRLHGSK